MKNFPAADFFIPAFLPKAPENYLYLAGLLAWVTTGHLPID